MGKKRIVKTESESEEGDVITIRKGSVNSKMFSDLENKVSDTKSPNWMVWDHKKKELQIKQGSFAEQAELLFDLGQVIEYYQR